MHQNHENGTLDQRVHKAAAARGAASRTIYRWLERFRRIAQPSSLLGFRPGPAKGLHILDAARERIVREVINGSYLKQPRARVEDIYREIGLRCTRNGLQPVARNTIRARIKALDPRLVARKRYGAKHARATAESAPGTFAVDGGLAVMQIDHTVADVNVVDETFRKPIGRPWLTLAVDVHTRMICGFHVSLNPPSQLSVALCLTHAVLAKDGWLAERHLDLNWPAAGLMKSLHSDNGRDLHGKGLEMGSREWGIQWVFRPPATPHFGGHIERLIGTVMGAVHLLPGTTYSNTHERGNYASEDAATLSMAELESWLAIQICDGYHQTPHSALGMTPTMAWKLAAHHGMEVVMPSDSRRFLLSFLPVVRRTLQRSGLYVNNIRYWSDVLPAIAPVGKEVFLRVDPRNLSKVYVRARDGAYIDVPYADIRYPPISLWEQRAAARALREEGAVRIRQEALFKKAEGQRQIVEEAAAKNKEARRHVERLRRATAIPVGAASTEPASVNYDIDAPPFAVETWESDS